MGNADFVEDPLIILFSCNLYTQASYQIYLESITSSTFSLNKMSAVSTNGNDSVMIVLTDVMSFEFPGSVAPVMRESCHPGIYTTAGGVCSQSYTEHVFQSPSVQTLYAQVQPLMGQAQRSTLLGLGEKSPLVLVRGGPCTTGEATLAVKELFYLSQRQISRPVQGHQNY